MRRTYYLSPEVFQKNFQNFFHVSFRTSISRCFLLKFIKSSEKYLKITILVENTIKYRILYVNFNFKMLYST